MEEAGIAQSTIHDPFSFDAEAIVEDEVVLELTTPGRILRL